MKLVFSPFHSDYDQFPLIIMTVIYLTREGMALEIRPSCLGSVFHLGKVLLSIPNTHPLWI